MDNKFITRGISKETNEFVYGYYVHYDNGNRDIIVYEVEEYLRVTTSDDLRKNGKLNTVKIPKLAEITQEPDRWTGLKDDYDNKIWEKDILRRNDEYNYIVRAFRQVEQVWSGYYRNISDICVISECKIIGNTHFNKELLEANNGKD